MYKFLYKHNLSKFTKKKQKILQRRKTISIIENEFIIKNLFTQKTQRPDGLIGEFFHLLKFRKKDIIEILSKSRKAQICKFYKPTMLQK